MKVSVLSIRYGNYAERLRALGMNQKDVAAAAGISPQQWSLIVRGHSRNPAAVTAGLAAEALGMKFDELWEIIEVDAPTDVAAPKDEAAGRVSNAALVAA